jgi:hypothetical protein
MMALDTQTDDPALQPLTAFNTDSGALPPLSSSVTPRVSAPPSPQEDDPALKPLEAFNWSGTTPYTPKPSSTMADVGYGLSYGLHTGVAAPLAEVTGQTEEAAAQRKAGEEAQEAMTPGAEQTPSVWLAEQAAPTVVMIAPSFIPGVGWVASGAMGATVLGGSAISSNKAAIDQANDMDLMQSNPQYAADRRSGLTEQQAKDKLGQSMALSVGAPSAILGAITGGAGGAELTGALKVGVGEAENAALTGGSLLTRRVTGRVPSAIAGAGRGLVEQGLPGAGQEYVSKHAEVEEGVGQEATSEDILSAGLGQGLFGAGMAGVGGAWHGKGPDPTVARTPADRTQTGGAATVPRQTPTQRATESKRTDGSTPNTTTAPADTPANAAAAGPPPAPPKVDPAQSAALGAAPVTQGVSNAEGNTGQADIYRDRGSQIKDQNSQRPNLESEKDKVKAPPQASAAAVPQKEVIQPEVVPIQPVESREGQGQANTTGVVEGPQKVADAGPAPIPAPPREDTAAIAREPDETLRQQHAAMLDPGNPREAMVYPKDVQPIELTKKSRYGQQELADGRTIQYDRSGPSKLSAAKVKFADDNNRLNEILQLGPVPKDEAVARASAGEPEAVVTERTPDGTEAKAAAGTTATAPEQVASLEAAKTPGNVVSVERPEDVVADRLARTQGEVAQEPVVQPQVVNPLGKGRVLEGLDPESVRARDAAAAQDALQAQTVAERLRVREAAKQEAAAKEAGVRTTRQHTSAVDQAKVAADNIAAKRITDAHPAPPSLDNVKRPTIIYDRAKAMVDAAKAAGIKIPDAFPEGHPHNASMLKLREAADLTAKKAPKWDAYARFLDREHMIDHGKADEAFAVRRNEGALGLGSPEGAVEHGKQDQLEKTEETGEHVIEGETAHEEAATELPTELAGGGEEHEKAPDAFTAAREERERKIAAARAESEALRKEEAPAPKAAMGFKQEVRKNRSIKRQEMEEGQEGAPGKKIMQADEDGEPQEITSIRQSNAKDAIDEHYDPKKYSPAERQMNDRLIDKLNHLAGDTEVHYISHDDMTKLGGPAYGFYDPVSDKIYINNDYLKHDTALHEVFHAATAKALEKSPELRDLMERLRNDVRANMPLMDIQSRAKVQYALSDPEEFLTGMMTNPDVQRLLRGVKISDDLAQAIGIPKWRKATMWNGVLHIIQRALGLEPRDVSAIEGAMAITEKTMWSRDPGMAMEAAARADRAARAEAVPVSLPKLKWQKMDPPEKQAEDMASDAQDAVQKPPSFWNSEAAQALKSGSGEKFFNAKLKGSFTDALRIDNEHMFGPKDEANPMRRAQEGLLKQGHMIQNMLKEHDDLMQRMAAMKRTNPDGLERVVSLLSEAHDFNVHPDEPLGVGLNDYIKGKVDKKTGEPTFGIDSNAEHHEAIMAHPRLSDEFEHSTPEEQALFKDMRDTIMEEGQRSVKANIETFTDKLQTNFDRDEKLQEALKTSEANRTPADIKRVERYNAVTKVINGEKLEEDEAENYGADPHIKMVRDLRGMLKQEGPHFPGTRKGGWVVNAEHELPDAPNALSVKDNEVTFGSKQDAYDYRQKLVERSLPSDMQKVSEPTSTEQKPGQGEQYKVTVQNKHSSAVNSVHEGRLLSEKLKGIKGINPDSITQPMLRERNDSIDYGLHSGTLRAQEHAIDALTHLGKDEKAALKEANEQAALGLMKGNRMNRGLLKSNRVRGANADPVLAMHDYLANSARSRARSKTLPDIDAAFGEMREHARNMQDADTPKRTMLVKEMEDRSQNFGKEGFTGQMNPWLQKLTTLAYVKDMMAPIHYALDLTRPFITSIPHIAGRHGFANAHATYLKTMSDMGAGGTLGRGVKGMFSALKGGDHMPTDLMTSIRNNLAKSGATADELRAFDVGRETPHLGSIVTDYRRSFDRTGKLDRGAQYLQDIGNEMSHAVDSVNRVGAYMTAYRAERAKMGKANTLAENVAHHAQAVRYAKDTVSQTQGIYSAANRASFMKNPMVRAAMQFRSVPMMTYRLLAKNAYLAVKGETREVKQAAIISLLSTMGSTAALAGAAAGVPEPIRLAVEMSHALGLTGSWQDYEDQARRSTTNSLGKFGGSLVMDGILGAAGLDAGSRIGLSDLMVKNQALKSPTDFLLEMVGGAGVGYVKDEWTGASDILAGDYKHGIPNVIPIRLFSDIAKAYNENQEGKAGAHGNPDMKPLDPYETFIRAIGGTPTREALYNKETGLVKEEAADKKAETQKAASNPALIGPWNRAHPHNKITVAQTLKAKQQTKVGKPPTVKQKQMEEDYSVYQ